MPTSLKLRFVVLLAVLGCTAGCDQTSKQIARSKLSEGGFFTLPGGFGELRLAENPGAFLGVGDSLPDTMRLSVFTVGIGVGLLGLLVYLVVGRRLSVPAFTGFACAWAGGTSNWIDRMTRHGRVSDFIFLRVGPFHTGIFNVADVVILFGLALVAYDLWWRRQNGPARVQR